MYKNRLKGELDIHLCELIASMQPPHHEWTYAGVDFGECIGDRWPLYTPDIIWHYTITPWELPAPTMGERTKEGPW